MTSYAVHLPDGGTSEYVGHEFHSVVKLGGILYALKSDGLCKLEGDSDGGVEISANVGLGYQGGDKLSGLHNIYFETQSADKLTVVIPARQGVFEYLTRTCNENLRVQRADLGKGLRESKYYVFVRNVAGSTFTVFDVLYNRITGSRRI